jgi:hypothetical protein
VKGTLTLSYPDPPVVPEIVEFYEDRLNEEQADILRQWLEQIAVGASVLEQDLDALLDRALSTVGPVGCVVSSRDGIVSHVMLPKHWRKQVKSSEGVGARAGTDNKASVDSEVLFEEAEEEEEDEDRSVRAGEKLDLSLNLHDPKGEADAPVHKGFGNEIARKALVLGQTMHGIDEHVGVVSLHETIDRILQPGSIFL